MSLSYHFFKFLFLKIPFTKPFLQFLIFSFISFNFSFIINLSFYLIQIVFIFVLASWTSSFFSSTLYLSFRVYFFINSAFFSYENMINYFISYFRVMELNIIWILCFNSSNAFGGSIFSITLLLIGGLFWNFLFIYLRSTLPCIYKIFLKKHIYFYYRSIWRMGSIFIQLKYYLWNYPNLHIFINFW